MADATLASTTVAPRPHLGMIVDLCECMSGSADLRDSFSKVMQSLSQQRRFRRACLLILDDATGKLRAEAAFGLTNEEMDKGRYFPGEGISGSVLATGKPRIIRDVREEPDFLNRTGFYSPENLTSAISFLCVPIRVDGRLAGATWVDKAFDSDEELRKDEAILHILASMVSQCLRADRLIYRQKEDLLIQTNLLRSEARDRYRFENIIGDAPAMQEVFSTVGQVANSRATVLLLGETGTGKEMIAKAIHFNSPRRNNSFVRVNCGALTGTLLESELFGHVKGSFTGAIKDKLGRFEAADGGTIFLDEIGTLEPELQVKLLRVLQEREFERVGDTHTVKIDVRVVAATNVDLQEEVAKGNFREDLFYRLNVVSIYLPPLRNRREDIPKLIDYFLNKYNNVNERKLRKISKDMMATLVRYPWPGNVRELENAVERAVVLSRNEEFTDDLLPLSVRMFAAQRRNTPSTESIETLTRRLADQAIADLDMREGEIYELVVEQVERALIDRALAKCSGVKIKAADYLGINRNTLNKKVKDLGIEAAD
jgi:Nif-specific regulatory protein